MIFSFFFACSTPCESPLSEDATIIELFTRLDQHHCIHKSDIHTLSTRMTEHHKQTTLHCDQVWRRSSIDGKIFDGPESLILSSASVADVYIEKTGSHVIAYNDLRPNLLADTAIQDPHKFWRMGLVGYGGLGLVRDRLYNSELEYIETDLHLLHPQEVVDPDISKTKDGKWRLVWFGVNPDQMNPNANGPLSSSKPHYFFRAESENLSDMGDPFVLVRSSEGMTGGADPTMATLPSGEDVLMVGPLDTTVMGWISKEGKFSPLAKPDLDTRAPLASPDLIVAPDGTLRLYGMKNGTPSEIWFYTSTDGINWKKGGLAYKDKTTFNASVSVDPAGTWWLYYNRTDEECLKKWGSKRVLPPEAPGTNILPNQKR